MRRDAKYVANEIGKSENWVKRHARELPHHRAGQTYYWTDDDIRALHDQLRVRPEAPQDGALRPVGASGSRRSA